MVKQSILFQAKPPGPKLKKVKKKKTKSKVISQPIKSMTMEQVETLHLIERRRRQILVHSFIYYELNDNFISDSEFDRFCEELVALQEEFPELSKLGEEYNNFKDFDGSSGYDLLYRQPWIESVASGLQRARARGYRGNVGEVYINEGPTEKQEDNNKVRKQQARKPSGPKLRTKKATK